MLVGSLDGVESLAYDKICLIYLTWPVLGSLSSFLSSLSFFGEENSSSSTTVDSFRLR
jgi:hypothetical protein